MTFDRRVKSAVGRILDLAPPPPEAELDNFAAPSSVPSRRPRTLALVATIAVITVAAAGFWTLNRRESHQRDAPSPFAQADSVPPVATGPESSTTTNSNVESPAARPEIGDPIEPTEELPGLDADGQLDEAQLPRLVPVGREGVVIGFVLAEQISVAGPASPDPNWTGPSLVIVDANEVPIGFFDEEGFPELFTDPQYEGCAASTNPVDAESIQLRVRPAGPCEGSVAGVLTVTNPTDRDCEGDGTAMVLPNGGDPIALSLAQGSSGARWSPRVDEGFEGVSSVVYSPGSTTAPVDLGAGALDGVLTMTLSCDGRPITLKASITTLP